MYGLIDAHFHIDMYKNYDELFKYIENERQYTLCMTNSPGVFASCRDLFADSKYIKFALGFHPLNTELTKEDMTSFEHLLSLTSYVGEIGLDFSRKRGLEKQEQVEFFEQIVGICSHQNKLMSVHIRNGESEAIKIISRYQPKKCIIHWYSGSVTELDRLIQLGCYFSVNTNMLKKMEILNKIPIDKLLIESDGPYTQVRGKRYSPNLLFQAYEEIAIAINKPDLINIVFSNFKTLLEL